jgi:hypothetical protein
VSVEYEYHEYPVAVECEAEVGWSLSVEYEYPVAVECEAEVGWSSLSVA